MKNKNQFLPCLMLVFLMACPLPALAKKSDVNLVLFRGTVYLLDNNGQKHPVGIGQVINTVRFPKVELKSRSSLYLKQGKKLVHLNQPGQYTIDGMFKNKTPWLTNAISFLKKLSQPRLYTSLAPARGNSTERVLDDPAYFEDIWERIVLESQEKVSQLPARDLLAAASWFSQQEKKARVAFILERLNSQNAGQNEFYRQLRLESLRGVRLVEINRELKATRQHIASKNSTLRYKALLIGINRYNHPAWQHLKNPISDVRALKQVLINHYYFEPADINLLENATYDDIVEAFNQLKEFSGDNTSLLVYYAGHGFYPQDEGEGYWIPRDAGEPESLRLFLPTSTVLGKINSIKTKHTLLIADSCFSGSLIRKTRGVETNSRFYQDLSRKKSRQIITSGGLEPVDDQGAGRHSIFAGKLLSILRRDRQEPLSASELAFHLRKEVKNAWVDQTPEYGRLQIADDENGEFFFVPVDEKEFKKSEPLVQPTPVAPLPQPKAYSYLNLPRGSCLAPQPFTDLRQCNFRNKKIVEINMEGANLAGVDFRYVRLEDTVLKGANLKDTDWRYSTIESLNAAKTSAANSDWRYTRISEADFSHGGLQGAEFRYTFLDDVQFDHADLTRADIRYSSMEDVTMEGTNLKDVRSNSNELIGDKIKGIVVGIGGAIEGLRQSDQIEASMDTEPTSQDNRRDSLVYLGIKPFTASTPGHNLRPFNLGIYPLDNLQLGVEFGKTNATTTTATVDAEATILVKGAYLRFFANNSFNLMLGVNQYTWTGEATATSASNSALNRVVKESEVVYLGTFAIGNQWLLDSGVTIGVDWALLSGRLGDPDSDREIENNGGSAAETSRADAELEDLEEKLEKEMLFSNRDHYLTLSIGFSF